MIKGRIENAKVPTLLLGITRENVRRMLDDQPIMITQAHLTQLGLPDGMEIVLIAGETEASLSEMLGGLPLQPEVPGQEFTQRSEKP